MANRTDHVLDFIHGLKLSDIPDDAVYHGKRCLLDLIGVAAAGLTTENSRIVRDFAARYEGAGAIGARLVFDGRRVSVPAAAMANAATIDSFDAHDGLKETKGHAGAVVLPALLALCDEIAPCDGAEFLTRFILGYEVACRAGLALHASVADYHTSGAWTALAAAGLFSRGMKLSKQQTWEALGTAEYYGPRSQMMRCIDAPTMVKDGATYGAQVGATAALLAVDGFTGAPAITISDDAVARFWSNLGSHWYMSEQYLKPYGVCRWAQPAVKAALTLREKVSVDAIAQVEVITFHEAVRLATKRPKTTEEAQYSLPYPVAAALLTGGISPEVITKGLDDPAILAMVDKIVMSETDEINATFPKQRLAAMRITLTDGRTVSCDAIRADGDPEAPLSDAEVEAKFRDLAHHSLEPATIDALKSTVDGITSRKNASDLTDLLLCDPGRTWKTAGRFVAT